MLTTFKAAAGSFFTRCYQPFRKHNRSYRVPTLLLLIFMVPGNSLAAVGGIAPKFLLDPKSPNAIKQIKPAHVGQANVVIGKNGFTVTLQGGTPAYPGVTIKSSTGTPWNLTAWGHVQAKIKNLGKTKLSLTIRVDNTGKGNQQPWNAETIHLKPGENKVIKVIFGHSYGFKLGYKLNPGAVSQILIFAGKSATTQSFSIEALQAAGVAGEKPPRAASMFRSKPKNGVIFPTATPIITAKQLVIKNNARVNVSPDGKSITVNCGGGKERVSITLKPAIGSWQLTDFFHVQMTIKNIGQTPITLRARLESKSGTTDTVATTAPIRPGHVGKLVIPFGSVVSPVIPTDPRQEVFRSGKWSEQTWGPKKGTGTNFNSGWVKGVTVLSDPTTEAHRFLITSIIANVPKANIPLWVGKRPPVAGDWLQTLNENFDKDTINLSLWNVYTDNYWDKRTHFSKDNAYIKDGKLILHYEKKSGFHNDNPNDTKTVGKTDYACGFADTYGKWAQRYGYFEARMKLPKAPGLWPAFWTMPDRGVKAGPQWKRGSTGKGGMEHDILEFLSGWGPYRYNLAFHWDGYGKEHKSAGTAYNYVLPDKDGFVTTGVYWIPGLAVYYAQGKEVLRWKSPRVCSVPSYIMFNMVSGGWDNVPLEDAKLPDDFVIDYIRVWQRRDLISPKDGAKPNKGLRSSLPAVPAK